jgi:hypothetical protein
VKAVDDARTVADLPAPYIEGRTDAVDDEVGRDRGVGSVFVE